MKKRVTFFLDSADLDRLKVLAGNGNEANGEPMSYGSLIRRGVRMVLAEADRVERFTFEESGEGD